MLFPVYEFRPHPSVFRSPPRRYAEGRWIEDDGEYDVCFIGSGLGENYSLFVQLPHHRNIVCSWLSGHWSMDVTGHPGGNPWHRSLKDGETSWGEPWGRERHLNDIAGREGMSKVCSEWRCANGRHVEFYAEDKHIAAGLVRNRETKEVFRFPENLKCIYCGVAAPIRCEAVAA